LVYPPHRHRPQRVQPCEANQASTARVMDAFTQKNKKLVEFLSKVLDDTSCDEESALAVYVHLQQAASVLMDQRIRHETKAKKDDNKMHESSFSQITVPPKVSHRITYESKLVIPKGKTPVSVIIPIVNFATNQNQKLHIGGMLFCDVVDGKIIQVLEGDRLMVTELVSKISKDKRHTGFKVLKEETVRDRRYESWGMQFAQSPRDWDTITSILREQRRQQGFSRAKGFGSFNDLTSADNGEFSPEPVTALKPAQGLSGLSSSRSLSGLSTRSVHSNATKH